MRRFLSILMGEDPDAAERGPGHDPVRVATAALMVEAARIDGGLDEVARDRIQKLLAAHYRLTPWVAADLLAEAERVAGESVAWQGLTSTIKDGMPPEERIAVIELLWELVYADGRLGDYEASLLRRVAGLLYVSDRDSGEARLRVMDRLGIARGQRLKQAEGR